MACIICMFNWHSHPSAVLFWSKSQGIFSNLSYIKRVRPEKWCFIASPKGGCQLTNLPEGCKINLEGNIMAYQSVWGCFLSSHLQVPGMDFEQWLAALQWETAVEYLRLLSSPSETLGSYNKSCKRHKFRIHQVQRN